MKLKAGILAFALAIAGTAVFAQTSNNAQNSEDGARAEHREMHGERGQKRMEWLSKELDLTADQKAKLEPIFKSQFEQMKAIREDSSLSQEQKHEKMKQLRETTKPQIEAVLTPDQQQKLAKLRDERREHMRDRANDAGDKNKKQ